MPNKYDNFDKLVDQISSRESRPLTDRELVFLNQTNADLMFGTPTQRAEQAKAKQAEVPALNLKSALTDLLNFPGTTVNVTPEQIESANYFLEDIVPRRQTTPPPFGIKPVVDTRGAYAQNIGKELIIDNLYSKITDLEKTGINDDNINAFNDISREIKNYFDMATTYQEELEDRVRANSSILAEAPALAFTERGKGLLNDIGKDQEERKSDVFVKSTFLGINKKLTEIKAPYLGKKFLEDYREFAIKDPFERYTNNPAGQFNKLFDPNKPWKDNDSFVKAMQAFAYENASPGEDIFVLQQEDIQKLLNNPDPTESERVTLKNLEETTLNGIGNYLYREMKNPANAGNSELLADYEAALDNINKRVSNGKKTYDVDSYNKFERSTVQFFFGAGRTLRSWASALTPYEYQPDPEHLGNDIKYGPVPVDLNKDGKLDTDKYGNLILSNQFTYVKKDGSLGYNAGAIPELSTAIIGQMLPILAVDALTRKGGSKLIRLAAGAGETASFLGTAGRATAAVAEKWNAINTWKGLRIADRVSTFGLVTGGVYGDMYQDELRWTKDRDVASKRALGRAVVEGLTEAIGAPEIGMFTPTRFGQSVRRGLLTMFTPDGATTSQKLGNFILNGARVGKLALTQSITESLEEEMALYGNYLLGKMIKSQDAGYGKEDVLDGLEMTQTFLDSLVGMAPYSLLGVGIQQANARRKLGPEHETLWDMANNPDYYRAKIKELLDKKKFTPEQAAQALQVVAESKGILDSIPEFANIKDLRTLLSDKDAQKKYFHDVLYREKLQRINYDELNEEQKKALKNGRISNLLDKNATKELKELSKKENLTEEEQVRKAELEAFKNITYVSTHDFTQAERKKLVSLGVLEEDDFKNSEEDLLEELKSVDKSILKTKKRVDQFINMSEEEKEKIVAKLFQEQIDSVQNLNDPSIVEDRLTKVKQQLEFVETMPTKYKTEQTGRQALIQALETKLGEQIEINPRTGRNQITEEFLQEDTSVLSHWQLRQRDKKLKRNKDYINERDYQTLSEENNTLINQGILEFAQMSEEDKEAFLVEYLTEAKNSNLDLLFELDTLERNFTLQNPETKEILLRPNISQELFDSVRDKVYERSAQEKKEPVITEESIAEEEEEVDGDKAFTAEEEKILQDTSNVDETGKADKTLIANLFERHNKTNDKTSTLSKEAFANKLIRLTEEMLKKYGMEIEDVNLWNRITRFIKNTTGGVYNSSQILSEGKAILNALPPEYKDKIGGVFNLAKYASKFFRVNPRRKSLKTGESIVDNQQEREDTAEDTAADFLENAPQETTPQNTLQQQANAEATSKEKALVERQNAVIQLQIPSSTYGFEVPENNELSSDPAIQRNADILRFLAQQDYSTTKVRVTSRLNFLQQLAADQGLNFQDFMDLLNKAHEAYKAIKGSPAKKAEQLAPMLKELNDFFGEDFFEQTLSSGRNLPELLYMVEKNGANLSDPILTIVNSAGAIQSFDGYPFYTNIDSDPRILEKEDTKRLPYWENILGERVAELQQFAPIAKAVVALAEKIKANPTHSEDFPISRITQGTFITETETLTPLQESGLEVTKENIEVLRTPKQKLGNETVAGVPGQTFLVINESPVVLMNDKVDELEAEALAAMVFNKTLREKFFPGDDVAEEAEKLKQHIAKILNIYQKQGRKVVFAFDQETQELVPFIPGVSGSQLNQEQLTKLFKELYYNVSEKQLSSMVPRFSMQEGEVVKVADQTYMEFVKSTNKVYMSKNTPSVRRNQRIIFDMGVAAESLKVKPVTQQPPAPATSKPNNNPIFGAKPPAQAETETETDAALAILDEKNISEEARALNQAIKENKGRAELVKEIDEDGKETSYYLIDGNRYERVSTEIVYDGPKAKSSFTSDRAKTVGGVLDGILRSVFSNKTPTKPDVLSQAAFNSLVSQAKAIYNTIKEGYIIIAEEITVWNEEAKIAGTLDMLFINKQTGQVEIVDFKSSNWTTQVNGKILGWDSETKSFANPVVNNPKKEHLIQQNSYGLMFSQQYGVTPGLNLMYIGLEYKNKDSYDVVSANILTNDQQPIIGIPTDRTLVIPSLQENTKAVGKTQEVVTLEPAETVAEVEEISTPEGFSNRVHESFTQIGTPTEDSHITEEGYTYRTIGQGELDAIVATGGVYAREGKQKGGNINTKYWTKGNGKNFYNLKEGNPVIRIKNENLKLDKVAKASDIEVLTKDGFVPLSSLLTTTQAQEAPSPVEQTAPATTDLKADIERRRKISLTKISEQEAKSVGGVQNLNGYYQTGDFWEGVYITTKFEGRSTPYKSAITATSEEELLKQINAKYDAELVGLEAPAPVSIEVKPAEQKVEPELGQEETFNLLAASLTPAQIDEGKGKKKYCNRLGKDKQTI